MSYRLVYTKNARKDVSKLDRIVKKKIGKKIEFYKSAPVKYARRLTDTRIGIYRWRAGNHRIIFDIVDHNIVILRIRHRREVYR